MRNKLPAWKERTGFEKLLGAAGLVLDVLIFVLAVLYVFDVIESINVVEMLLGCLMAVQGLQWWKYSRMTSILSFAAAAFVAAVSFLVIF